MDTLPSAALGEEKRSAKDAVDDGGLLPSVFAESLPSALSKEFLFLFFSKIFHRAPRASTRQRALFAESQRRALGEGPSTPSA
jgi:hypothetical protein